MGYLIIIYVAKFYMIDIIIKTTQYSWSFLLFVLKHTILLNDYLDILKKNKKRISEEKRI